MQDLLEIHRQCGISRIFKDLYCGDLVEAIFQVTVILILHPATVLNFEPPNLGGVRQIAERGSLRNGRPETSSRGR